jgi:hypothetical protein
VDRRPAREPGSGGLGANPGLRDKLLACLHAAMPSRLRTQGIDAFARSMPRSTPTSPLAPVDWDGLENEAARRGITLAELIAELGSDDPDPFSI